MKQKNKRQKKSIKNIIWDFIDKHPRLDRFISESINMVDKFMIAYFVFAICLILIPVVIVYYTLPEEVRRESSAIIGSILSLIVIPLIMNSINRKKENERNRFEENKSIYLELSAFLLQIVSKNESTEDIRQKFERFIVDHYDYMCLNFASSLISEIYRTYRAYTNSHLENARVYAEKCIKHIRRESGDNKEFMYSSLIFDLINKR